MITIQNADADMDGDGPTDSSEDPSDGIANAQDFDPLGYFYSENNGQIIPDSLQVLSSKSS